MMKKIILLTALTIFLYNSTIAQEAKKSTITIKTSAQCEMCKNKIEFNLAYEKGIVKSNLDIDTKELTVVYRNTKTNADKIRLFISNLGYDADSVKADEKAYENIPDCCKKPEDRHKNCKDHNH